MSSNSKNSAISLSLAALGVVFGDIGTSPLYALKECFSPHHGLTLSDGNILGLLSLFFWSLSLVIVLKYILFILRADNNGQGGIVSLMSLVQKQKTKGTTNRAISEINLFVIIGLFGTALLYGDGIITPAISVLSAVEGLSLISPSSNDFIVPITVVILFALFMSQRFGTSKIGIFFGPILAIWFLVLAAISIPWIVKYPKILFAVSPHYAIEFFIENKLKGFLSLSSVVLCITGGEALYADMGHFGREPIKKSWFYLVFPALVLNYFGQGAMLLIKGEGAISNPFFNLVSESLITPLVIISTISTIIASQALITGAFSVTQQIMQLGFIPKVVIKHTSRETEGQIYIPYVNSFLMIGSILLVLMMKQSSNLASAYGIAVTGTMALTSVLFYEVTKSTWNWSKEKALLLFLSFISIDLLFFSANLAKFFSGGWIPILIGVALFWAMITWNRGRLYLYNEYKLKSKKIIDFLKEIKGSGTIRVPGTAVVMTINQGVAPNILITNMKHNKILHEKVILLSIYTVHSPEVNNRVMITDLGEGFIRVIAKYGFMEVPKVMDIIDICKKRYPEIDKDLSFYISKETILPNGKSTLTIWSKKLYIFMAKNAQPVNDFFKIPQEKIIEIGSQISL
jgi:KUP system potassium uptake protein